MNPMDLYAHNKRQQAKGKLDLLSYLIGVARDTQGAEVWRALFAEMRKSIESESSDEAEQ